MLYADARLVDEVLAPWTYGPQMAALAEVTPKRANAAEHGLPAGPWKLIKATLRRADYWLLLYEHRTGRQVAGQWYGDARAYAKARRATAAAAEPPAAVLTLPQPGLFWQVNGADRALPGLAPLCRAGASLVVHHPERRAVVRLPGAVAPYVKIVRPERAAPLAAALERVGEALGPAGVATPQVLALDVEAGAVTMSALPGRSLRAWLSEPETPLELITAGGEAAGRALAALHAANLPAETVHDGAAEIAVLERWIERLGWLAPTLHTQVRARLDDVAAALAETPAGPFVPLHRDSYDKQFITDGERIGLLDFDTLTVGEAALDVANLLVHCELRVHQRACSPERAAALARSLAAGYGAAGLPPHRLQAYADGCRLRLACVYACRPPQTDVVAPLLAALGAPAPGT